MLRCAAKHLLPDVTASGEENLVERLVKQRLILHAPALDDGNFLQRKHSAQICRMMAEVAGASFDGFRMQQLPPASAPSNGSMVSRNG